MSFDFSLLPHKISNFRMVLVPKELKNRELKFMFRDKEVFFFFHHTN